MLTFGFGIGTLLVVIGIITYLLAPRVGPNPFFGVRVGYSFASREVWDKTNRLGGSLIALVGLVLAGLAAVLQLLNVAARDGMTILTTALFATLLGAVVWMFLYARGLAQGTMIAREVTPVKFRWAYLAPVVVTFVLLIALAAYFYPALPADRLATHFDFNDQPNGWSTRDGFLLSFLGMAALFVLLDAAVVFIATREPLIAFGRWGSTWRLDPERGLIFAGIAFALTNLILMAALWDVAWFNTRGVHAFPLSLFLWMIIPLIVILVGLFFLLGRRSSSP
ncbi:MAG: SdpI family protein [Chloroflexi bacterium]|nr:SdpI family protein [Chloroflexota bacterium]